MIQLNRDRCPGCGKRLAELIDCDTSMPLIDKVVLILALLAVQSFLLFAILEVVEALQHPCGA